MDTLGATLSTTPNLAATGIASDGTVLYVSDSAGNITKINLATEAISSPTPLACSGPCKDMAFDGQFLWRITQNNRLQKIDPATLILVQPEIELKVPLDPREVNTYLGSGLTWDGTSLIGTFCITSCGSASVFMQIN